jgi:hypothetical protein
MKLSRCHVLVVSASVATFLLMQACGGRTDLDGTSAAGAWSASGGGGSTGTAGKGGTTVGYAGSVGTGGLVVTNVGGGGSVGTGGLVVTNVGGAGYAGMGGVGPTTGGRTGTGGVSVTGGRTGTGGAGATGGRAGSIGGYPMTGGRGGAASGGAGGSVTGLCAEVPCYAELINNCLPEGKCQMQLLSGVDTANVSANVCYSNGVKGHLAARLSDWGGVSGTATYKRGNTTCFSVDITQSSLSGFASYVFRNAKGTPVATATENTTGMTMTCMSGRPTRLSQACMNAGGGDSECTDGICSY